MGIRQLKVERHRTNDFEEDETVGYYTDGWCIWLMANKDFSIGTYLLLRDDGSIARVTIEASGEERIFEYEDAQDIHRL